MVTRETNYIGQLYFGLSTDDPTAVEWHNGDRILLMDQDIMMVYDEAAFDFHEIPISGGGGGGGPVITPTSVAIKNARASGNLSPYFVVWNPTLELPCIANTPTLSPSTVTTYLIMLYDGCFTWRLGASSAVNVSVTYNGNPIDVTMVQSAYGNNQMDIKIPLPANYDPTIPIELSY